jgi:hypothetical protein
MAANRRRHRNDSNVPVIEITREVKLKVGWKELATKLGEVLPQGFLTALGGDGISGGISALMGAISAVKVDAEPGEKAWSLAVLCFAWALDELKSLPGIDAATLRNALDDALQEAKEKVDARTECVPVTFLERPTTLPLYQFLRYAIVARKATFRSGVHESDDALKARFDSAYDRAMFEVFARRSDLYQSLAVILDSPAAKAAERQINWITYRSKLIYDFEVRPVFGQESTRLSLSQLYVPLRGYWPKNDAASETSSATGLSRTHDIAVLDEVLDKWIRSPSERESNNIRL